ncbi:MAG TPA: hypothetical protein PKZ07_19905, partial [Sedimentisphaerales bacterium]|nr:hypothetical protein [Sedimentisphaerales bacterium]
IATLNYRRRCLILIDTFRGKKCMHDFRHAEARRKNNPPAGIAPTYEVRERQTTPYAYDRIWTRSSIGQARQKA